MFPFKSYVKCNDSIEFFSYNNDDDDGDDGDSNNNKESRNVKVQIFNIGKNTTGNINSI